MWYASATLEVLLSRVWKECYKSGGPNADKLGADAVVFDVEQDQDQQGTPSRRVLVAHRIQIKLGRGEKADNNGADTGIKSATEVRNTFNTMRSTAEQLYLRADVDAVKLRHYMLTTRQLAGNARALLEHSSIKLLGPKDLSHDLWPQSLKELGKPFV